MNEVREALVAIVDDDRRMLASLENLLESAGFRTRAFVSGHAFLESGTLPSIRCLISDIYMPNMTGWELEQRIRLERPELPIILISGNDETFLKAPVDGDGHRRVLLRKPLDTEKLLAAVGAALAK